MTDDADNNPITLAESIAVLSEEELLAELEKVREQKRRFNLMLIENGIEGDGDAWG